MLYRTTVRVYEHGMPECVRVHARAHLPGGEGRAATAPRFPAAPAPLLGQLELPGPFHSVLSLCSQVAHEAR